MNKILTPEQITTLKIGLGLSAYVSKPTRNDFPRSCERGREAIIESLIDMELMSREKTYGQGGVEHYLAVTDEGRRLAVEEHQKVLASMRG